MKRRSYRPPSQTILIACTGDRSEYIVAFDQISSGLRRGSAVTLGGLGIGEVTDIRVGDKYEILVKVQIDNGVKIPTDSRFILDADFLGNGSIVIEPGTRGEGIVARSVLKGTSEETPRDTSEAPFANAIRDILGGSSTRQDSILIELRRLNDNLERLMENR